MSTHDSWQNSWPLFAKVLESELRSAASNERLAEVFGGARVRWRGIIEEISFDELSNMVCVALPVANIALGDGCEDSLDGLALSVNETETCHWSGLAPGDEITFEATLGTSEGPFPPVEVESLTSGKTLIMIRANGAVPVRSSDS